MEYYSRTPPRLRRAREAMRMILFVEIIFFSILAIVHAVGWNITYVYGMLGYLAATHISLWVMAYSTYCEISSKEFLYTFMAFSGLALAADLSTLIGRLVILSGCNTTDCATPFIYYFSWATCACTLVLVLIDLSYIILISVVIEQTMRHKENTERFIRQIAKVDKEISEIENESIGPSYETVYSYADGAEGQRASVNGIKGRTVSSLNTVRRRANQSTTPS